MPLPWTCLATNIESSWDKNISEEQNVDLSSLFDSVRICANVSILDWNIYSIELTDYFPTIGNTNIVTTHEELASFKAKIL